MTIRLATEADVELIERLWTAFQDELDDPPFMREAWDGAWVDLKRHIRDGLAFVAEADDEVRGFVFATVPSDTPDLGYVTDLYVVPGARRHGLGRQLLGRVVAELAERGIGHVGLDVRPDNRAARALYERLGLVQEQLFLAAPAETVRGRLEEPERDHLTVGSTHVQTDDEGGVERAVAQFVPRLGVSARTEVSGAENGWVTVHDELCDRDRTAHRRLAAELSERLGVPSIALRLEESAVVRYLLFERGRMVDEYLSVPTYYGELSKADELSLAANPTLVARLTGADPARVRAVVRTAATTAELPSAADLVAEVAAVLGLQTRIEP